MFSGEAYFKGRHLRNPESGSKPGIKQELTSIHIIQNETNITWKWNEKYMECWIECSRNKQNRTQCMTRCFYTKRCGEDETSFSLATTLGEG